MRQILFSIAAITLGACGFGKQSPQEPTIATEENGVALATSADEYVLTKEELKKAIAQANRGDAAAAAKISEHYFNIDTRHTGDAVLWALTAARLGDQRTQVWVATGHLDAEICPEGLKYARAALSGADVNIRQEMVSALEAKVRYGSGACIKELKALLKSVGDSSTLSQGKR